MAEKHKSKYKAPKDLEKSQKSKPRKDLKDYTMDDKAGGLNPKSTGDKQLNVLRKTDKEMVDTGDMYVKYNADDRLYKDIEDGEWDPKTAAKRLKKRQDAEEKETADVLKDKIENLTREQKEHVVREYIRRKITRVLAEQTDTEEPVDAPEAPEVPTDDATAPTDAPTDDVAAPEGEPGAEMPADDMGMGSMSAPAMSSPSPMSPDMPPAPIDATDPTADTTSAELTSDEIENRAVTSMATELEKEGSIGKIKAISKILKLSMKDYEIEDQATVYRMLRQFAIKKLNTLK
jgi:hypothetical protein